MALSTHKITDNDIVTKGVVAAPTELRGTATQNKQIFDRLIREAVKGDFNALIDALEGTGGAAEIGAEDSGGEASTVQAELAKVQSLGSVTATPAALDDAVGKKHSHDNKALLDTYTQTEAALADAVSKKHSHSNKAALDTVPSGGVVTTLGTDDTTVPTSKAVADALENFDDGDMKAENYDPGSVVATAGGIPAYLNSRLYYANNVEYSADCDTYSTIIQAIHSGKIVYTTYYSLPYFLANYWATNTEKGIDFVAVYTSGNTIIHRLIQCIKTIATGNSRWVFDRSDNNMISLHASSHATGGEDALAPADIGALPAAGGTMTGALTLAGAPTENLQAATKQYVDDSRPASFTVTLSAASWASNAQTVSNALFVSTGYAYTVAPADASFAAYATAAVRAQAVTVDGSCTFVCATAPTADLTVNILRTEVSA